MEKRIGACAVVLLVLGFPGVAQQYSFRHYGADEGLQNLAILSLAQDGAGYIWAGSEGGLYRYDGTRFRLMAAAEGLPCSTEARGLHVATDGALWVNTCAQVFRFDGKGFRPVAGLAGMLAGTESMANQANGHVVVATTSGLYEAASASDGSFSARPYPLRGAAVPASIRSVARHGSELWFGCGRQLCVEDGGRVSIFGPAEGLPDDSWDAIRVTPDGSVWARSPGRLYRKPPGGAQMVQEKPDIASSVYFGALMVLRDGSLLVPTDKGLAIRKDDRWSLIDDHRGLRNAMTSAVLEDREGSLWIAQIGAGVARWLGHGEWEAWTKAQGLPSDLIWSIRRARNGALWVGTSLGLARIDGTGKIRTWTRKDRLGGDNVRWLGETSDGAIWAVLKPGGVARVDPVSGRIRQFGASEGLPCGTSNRGFVDHLDRLWIASSCGVFRNDHPTAPDRFSRIEEPASLDRGAWALAESTDPQQLGAMWITNPDGLWRLRGGYWTQYRKMDGLASDSPYIPTTAADGSMWLHHRFDAGIERVEFSESRIVRSTEIVPVDASSIEVTALHGFDAFGRLWRGGANGVSILSADRSWSYLSTEDGLICNDTDGEAFWADADGGVWIGTSGGLAHYRPPHGSALAAPVADPVITSLEIDPKSRVVHAQFSSLNYKSEQLVKFAYRLDSDPWISTGNDKERSVSIAGLSPGRHRLEIQSWVRKGPISENVAALDFRIEPRWWESWWLRSAVLLLAAAAFWGAVWWRHQVLRLRNRHLEEAVRQRTAELEAERSKVLEEKRRADAASEAKGQFLANMSHEIRTPLNGVIGLSRLLESMAVPPEAQEAVRMIRSSGDALLRLINDVLDFSKVEAGKLELEVAPFHFPRALEESLDLFRTQAADKNLRLVSDLSPDLPVWVAGDQTRLRQVVLNLISNALKFTNAGEVGLAARLAEKDETCYSIALEVRDTRSGDRAGESVPAVRVVQPGRCSISRRYGGTGLGLAISKRMVELMGGSIEVESTPGAGTRFRFSVKVGYAKEPVLKASAAPVNVPGADLLKVLVAEDNVVNQRVAILLLKQLGVSADLAADGAKAIEAVKANRYDLVLMDLQMPEVDGLAATKEIRAILPAERQPLIYGLTAHATTEYRDICLAAGMEGYLTKPLDREKLWDLIVHLSSSREPACEISATVHKN